MRGPLVIVGDTLLDRDVDGSAQRVSPDAPALVLDEGHTCCQPGGAGLAAVLAGRSSEDVILITAFADDPAGAILADLLDAAGIQVHALRLPSPTPEKIRFRADGQVLMRLDRGGEPLWPTGDVSAAALAALRAASAILISDYGGGMANHPVIRDSLSVTSAATVWDPHPRGPAPVHGMQLVTPNEAEAKHFVGDNSVGTRLAAAIRRADMLRQRWNARAVTVTLGATGAVLCQGQPTPLVVPAPEVAIRDTRGAGDCFAVAALSQLAQGAPMPDVICAAVIEAGHFVATGNATPHLHDPRSVQDATGPGGDVAEAQRIAAAVRARGGTVVATGGCFDLLHAGHVATLEAARRLGDCLIVCLNSDQSVSALKGPGRPVVGQVDRARMLRALRCVDAVVIFHETTPVPTLHHLRPDIWVKGGDYAARQAPMRETTGLQLWHGQVVVTPYLEGRSTTKLITAAQRANGGRPPQ